ncbi:AAA family ATPase [Variovorax sp. LARHSF232]
MPDAAAEAAPSARTSLSGTERRQITLVFCDVVGSTDLAERLDPEDLTSVIAQFHRAVDGAMAEFDGFVARHMGDGTLTYFGYPNSHEDDAERALRASLRALEAVSALRVGDQPLRAHIGVASGLVVVGDIIGTGRPIDIDVAGATPNLAARLQGAALPDEILVCDTTRRLAGELFEWRDLGLQVLKGIAKPVRTWRVMGQQPVGSRFDAMHQGALSPLLGRDQAMAQLEAQWREVLQERGRVVVIEGEAGIGKSRLAAQMLDRLRPESHTLIRCASSSHRQHSPLHPWIQQLEQAAGFQRDDSPAEKLIKLQRTLPGTPERDLQLVAELLLVPTAGRFPVLQLGPQRRAELQMEAVLNALEFSSLRVPLVVLFEDAHWSDLSSRELLARLVERCARLRILLMVTARPEFTPPWIAQPQVVRLPLAPLNAGDSAQLVTWICAGASPSREVVADILARSNGIPLYLEELTRFVVECEADRSAGASVPSSLQASLQARLDRLGGAREIAEVAACIGREFPRRLLSLATNREHEDVEHALTQLVDESLILSRAGADQDGEALAFRHVLLRDVAYHGMVRERRRALHERIAQVLEEHFPERVSNQPDQMALHCAEGGMLAKSVGHWLLAGVQAMRRSAMTEALVYLAHGLDAVRELPDGPPRQKVELQLTIAKGQAQIATQGYAVQGTRETFEQARRLCGELNNPPQLLSVLHGLWTHALMTADMLGAREQALSLLERGKREDDPVWLLMGHRFCGVTHHPMGAFAEAVAFLRRGLELYEPSQRATYGTVTVDDPEIVMLTYLSWALMCMGQLDEARSCSARAVEKARALAQVYSLSHALIGAAFVGLTIEAPEAGLRRLDEVMPLLEEHGIAYYGAVGLLFKGWCLAALGEHAQAREVLASGMKAYRATGSRLYLSGFLRMTAESLARGGRDHAEAAWASLEEARAVMQATRQFWDEAEVHRLQGQLLLERGDRAGAIEHLRQARDVADRQSAGLWQLRTVHDLAQLHVQDGDRAGALELLEPVCQRLAGQSALPDVVRVRTLLETLR